VADTDEERDADYLADKILKLRVFSDVAGKFNLSATQVKAAFLVVSQFTLFADARGQNRPSFLRAARPELGRPLLERFIARLRASGLPVETGSFGAQMALRLVNDGPVTIVLSTDAWDPQIG
jgi:D-tyrosyl-tRNA(Tyr) deacylase